MISYGKTLLFLDHQWPLFELLPMQFIPPFILLILFTNMKTNPHNDQKNLKYTTMVENLDHNIKLWLTNSKARKFFKIPQPFYQITEVNVENVCKNP